MGRDEPQCQEDRKSTRLNSSHANISYAVFCLKKKTTVGPTAGDLKSASANVPDVAPTAIQVVVVDGYHGKQIVFTVTDFRPFFFNDTATTEIYTLSLHDALPI